MSFRRRVFSAKCLFGNVGKKSQEKSHGKKVIDLGRNKELMSKKKVTEIYHLLFSMNFVIFTNNIFINIFCLGFTFRTTIFCRAGMEPILSVY